MQGLKVGHITHKDSGTGVSVFLLPPNSAGGYWIAGSAPATHEVNALDPENSVTEMHALVFSGGSAYGLFAAKGVMQYLTEKGIGHPTPHGVVPIVPAAAIYDLSYLKSVAPNEADAYQACLNAREDNQESGRIGAGTGATVGKLIQQAKPMTGGIGRAGVKLKNGLEIIAFAVVNCVGDVRNETTKIIAGAKNNSNQFADCEKYLTSGGVETNLFSHSNTTLVSVFMNAKFNKSELKRIAKAATAGMARAIAPIFTRYDGDILFAISLGDKVIEELVVSTIASEVVRLAIIDAVKNSEVI